MKFGVLLIVGNRAAVNIGYYVVLRKNVQEVFGDFKVSSIVAQSDVFGVADIGYFEASNANRGQKACFLPLSYRHGLEYKSSPAAEPPVCGRQQVF